MVFRRVGPIRESSVRKSTFLDRCFDAVMLLAFFALCTATAFALIENEPRTVRTTLILHSPR